MLLKKQAIKDVFILILLFFVIFSFITIFMGILRGEGTYYKTENFISDFPYYYILILEKIGIFIFFWVENEFMNLILLLTLISIILGIFTYLLLASKRI
jgi:hypothetical protein